jgi:hypothetical protein
VHALLQVFHSSVSQEEAGWKESLYRMYATGSANMRVAVYGAKHDAAPYEELLRKFCAVQELVRGADSTSWVELAVIGAGIVQLLHVVVYMLQYAAAGEELVPWCRWLSSRLLRAHCSCG